MQRNTTEQRAQSNNVNSTHTAKPVYGNFQRYYHIRNPASSADAASTDTIDNPSVHPALALDTRVAAILRFLSSHFADSDADAATASSGQEGRGEVFSVLDIGCNSGKLTIQLAQTLPALFRKTGSADAVELTGVDIDPTLIKQANDAGAVARSLYRPALAFTDGAGSDGHEEQQEPQLPTEAVFFPSVFPALFGPITSATEESHRSSKRQRVILDNTDSNHQASHSTQPQLEPPSLGFIAAEWVQPHHHSPASPFHYPAHSPSTLRTLDSRRYSLTLALSITKWIHIQQSDSGLVQFFARLSSTLLPGGLVFLERQEWKSYSTAKNLDPGMRNKIRALQMRPGGDFDWLLEQMGLQLMRRVATGIGKGFERPLQVFRKIGTEQGKGGGEEELAREVLEQGARFDWVCRPPNALD